MFDALGRGRLISAIEMAKCCVVVAISTDLASVMAGWNVAGEATCCASNVGPRVGGVAWRGGRRPAP